MPWKRVTVGAFGLLFVAWLAGVAIQTFDPEGVTQREASAQATAAAIPTPTATFLPRAPTATIWVVLQARVTPTPVPERPRVGSEARIDVPGLERIPLAVDQKALDDLSKSAIAKDTVGWNEVIRQGRAFWVPIGTRVLILEHDWEATRVRLIDGSDAGRAGWIVSANVRP